jgi:hypothetical protein
MTKPTKYLINPNDPEQVEWLKEKPGVTDPVKGGGNQMKQPPFPGPPQISRMERDALVELAVPPPYFRRLLLIAGLLVVVAVDVSIWNLLRPSGVLRTTEGVVLAILDILAVVIIWGGYRMGQRPGGPYG